MNCDLSKTMKRYNHLPGEIDDSSHKMSLKLDLSDSTMIILYTIWDKERNQLSFAEYLLPLRTKQANHQLCHPKTGGSALIALTLECV